MSRPTMAQKLKDLRADNKKLQADLVDISEMEKQSHERAVTADGNAADAIRTAARLQKELESSEKSRQILGLELASLRGYTQRINQTDNAHQPANEVVTSNGEVHVGPAKYGLPLLGQVDLSGINVQNDMAASLRSRLRNR